ncbi:MAG: flagellar hook capping FlgD N-terminal domain-containing protein [Burkholderiales bacterium]
MSTINAVAPGFTVKSTSSGTGSTGGTSGSSSASSSDAVVAASAKDIEDRFLTLLVSQIRNQDPLNPLDNAQLTTQLAQISTVGGIDRMNQTLTAIQDLLANLEKTTGTGTVGSSGSTTSGGSGSSAASATKAS